MSRAAGRCPGLSGLLRVRGVRRTRSADDGDARRRPGPRRLRGVGRLASSSRRRVGRCGPGRLCAARGRCPCRPGVRARAGPRRRREARGARPRSSRRSAHTLRRATPSSRSASAPSCSPRPACSTDAGRRPPGCSPTSWRDAVPDADVRPERLVVTDAGVTTTAAFSAMYDFALDLIREHSGARVARTTARIALVDDARSSQTPYVDARLLPQPGTGSPAGSCDGSTRTSPRATTSARLADAFHVSTRTLLRRFADETGQSPLDYLQSARVRRAPTPPRDDRPHRRQHLHRGRLPGPGTFAALFAKHTGRRPRDYRAAFRRGDKGGRYLDGR